MTNFRHSEPVTRERVALVTGASSGFGALTANRLSEQGWRVFGTSRQEQKRSGVEMLRLEVCSQESVYRCVSEVIGAAGRVDLLINNAGTAHLSLVEETPPEDAEALFQTNFFGTVRVTNAVLPGMRERGGGRVINVGSLAGLVAVPGQAFYAASKHALEGYSESLRYEVEPFGISVSVIEPGVLQDGLARRRKHGLHLTRLRPRSCGCARCGRTEFRGGRRPG